MHSLHQSTICYQLNNWQQHLCQPPSIGLLSLPPGPSTRGSSFATSSVASIASSASGSHSSEDPSEATPASAATSFLDLPSPIAQLLLLPHRAVPYAQDFCWEICWELTLRHRKEPVAIASISWEAYLVIAFAFILPGNCLRTCLGGLGSLFLGRSLPFVYLPINFCFHSTAHLIFHPLTSFTYRSPAVRSFFQSFSRFVEAFGRHSFPGCCFIPRLLPAAFPRRHSTYLPQDVSAFAVQAAFPAAWSRSVEAFGRHPFLGYFRSLCQLDLPVWRLVKLLVILLRTCFLSY